MNLFWWLRLLALAAGLVSLVALAPRLQSEKPGPVALVMDGDALWDEALSRGISFEEALAAYRGQGVNGVALYEATVRSLTETGKITYLPGSQLALVYPKAGFRAGWFYLGGNRALLTKLQAYWMVPSEIVEAAGNTWLAVPLDVSTFPAGFDQTLVSTLKAKGYYLAIRPFNHPDRTFIQAIIPAQADAVVFGGTEVLGFPDALAKVADGTGNGIIRQPIALIEATPQDGFGRLAKNLPVLRLFSLKPEWQLKLKPAETADKFLLAAEERGHQILYIRPFQLAEDTRTFLDRLRGGLEASRIAIGTPTPRNLQPSPFRYAAWFGVLAGLFLLALGLPKPFGLPVAGLITLFAIGYARADAGPLLAALVFPALGFLEKRKGMALWLAAVGYSLLGAVFLTALGSRTETVLGLQPFKGVSLTLVVPPLLVALSLIPTNWKGAFERLWAHPVRLGEVALGVFALGALALVVLRRGNDASGIVPEWELKLRALLQDLTVRPRFKEVFAHALAPAALLLPWPAWVKNGMLLMVAVGMGSILNTFAHYHTPLPVSFFRVVNGIIAGLVLGFALLFVVRRIRRWWLG